MKSIANGKNPPERVSEPCMVYVAEYEPPASVTKTGVPAGTPVLVTEAGGSYSATYTIQGSDTLSGGFLPFAIDFIDCAGNVGLTDSTTSDESFVSIDIGPPEMVSVVMYSSNQDSSWAHEES